MSAFVNDSKNKIYEFLLFMFSPLEQFDIYLYIYSFPVLIPTIVVSNLVISMLIFLSLFFFLFRFLAENLKLVPSLLQVICEVIFKFIFNLIKQQIGTAGYVYFPLLLALFNFVFIMNLFSLLPFGLAITSHIIMIFWLSFSLCLSIFLIGFITHNLKVLYMFIPECPLVLLPMLILIEIFSYIIRAFSLAIRLSAISWLVIL